MNKTIASDYIIRDLGKCLLGKCAGDSDSESVIANEIKLFHLMVTIAPLSYPLCEALLLSDFYTQIFSFSLYLLSSASASYLKQYALEICNTILSVEKSNVIAYELLAQIINGNKNRLSCDSNISKSYWSSGPGGGIIIQQCINKNILDPNDISLNLSSQKKHSTDMDLFQNILNGIKDNSTKNQLDDNKFSSDDDIDNDGNNYSDIIAMAHLERVAHLLEVDQCTDENSGVNELVKHTLHMKSVTSITEAVCELLTICQPPASNSVEGETYFVNNN
jgi:hypothetical protein